MSEKSFKIVFAFMWFLISFLMVVCFEVVAPSTEYFDAEATSKFFHPQSTSILLVNENWLTQTHKSKLMVVFKKEDGSIREAEIDDPGEFFLIDPGCKIMVMRKYGWLTGFTYNMKVVKVVDSNPTDPK